MLSTTSPSTVDGLPSAAQLPVLIVHGDDIGNAQIHSIVGANGGLACVAVHRSIASASPAIALAMPRVIVVDADLGTWTDVERLVSLATASDAAVILLASAPSMAAAAYDVGVVDCVVKPLRPERLRLALDRAVRSVNYSDREESPPSHWSPAMCADGASSVMPRLVRFAVRVGQRVRFVAAANVEVVEAEGNYVRLYVRGEVFRVRTTMRDLEDRLDPVRFIRIHRSCIINVDHLAEIQPWFGGDYVAILSNGRQLRVSRTYAHRVLAPLQ